MIISDDCLISKEKAAAVETKPYFSMEVVDGVAVVRMDQPGSSMNTISVAMQDEFAGVLDEIENNPNINSAVLISAKPGCFVAGADIQMINDVRLHICYLFAESSELK